MRKSLSFFGWIGYVEIRHEIVDTKYAQLECKDAGGITERKKERKTNKKENKGKKEGRTATFQNGPPRHCPAKTQTTELRRSMMKYDDSDKHSIIL